VQSYFKSVTNSILSLFTSSRQRLPYPQLSSEFAFLDFIGGELRITYTKNGKTKTYSINSGSIPTAEVIRKELGRLTKNHKFVATGMAEHKTLHEMIPSLWLEDDIVTIKMAQPEVHEKIEIEEHLKYVISNFEKNAIANIRIHDDNEVEVSDLVSLEQYKKVTSPEEFQRLMALAHKFGGQKISFINATPQGGGVALMRHALIRLFKLLNVNAHWYVLKPDIAVFSITKRKFHNVLQNVAGDEALLTQSDKDLYDQWIMENARIMENIFKESDVIIIDDPQPSGLIPYIRKANPKAKIIYRSHIQIEGALTDKPGTKQHQVWQFLWKNIQLADLFISHPVKGFIPGNVPEEKVIFMPATTDLLDGLNKPLSDKQIDYYLHMFNLLLKEEGQSLLDLKRPYIIQVARFDPSKGIPDVLDAYYILCQMLLSHKLMLPQLIITGNGSIDDPDRAPVFQQTMDKINSKKFANLKKHIKVVQVPHIDQLLNALIRKSFAVMQLSTKEGFEIKVTEALMKGKPVVAYRAGGIPLQIKDNVNGFLVDIGDTQQVAKNLFLLMTDKKRYHVMSEAAREDYDKSLLTTSNAIRWLRLALGESIR
jgi:alpha,alpha-trehalose phosphorylase (configuration-retaining)